MYPLVRLNRVSCQRIFLLLAVHCQIDSKDCGKEQHQPDVLLMDEPFSALDAITREEMQDIFLRLWRKFNVSTIFVTHYVEEALYLGQKIVVLSAYTGGISQIIENPLFGGKDIRQQPEFFEMGLRLRNLIKKDWNQIWENQ